MYRFCTKISTQALRPLSQLRVVAASSSLFTTKAHQQDNIANTDAYQFMQQSKLPTLHFQPSLPRLPIPLLAKTCERFLGAVQPILTSERYDRTQKIVHEFCKHDGMQLQALLKQMDAANKHTSYISEPWFDMYLSDRTPLPINYNPLLVMKNDTRQEYQQQLIRATNLIISSLRFWRSLRAGLLEPEVYHLNSRKSDTKRFRQMTQLAPTLVATYVAYAFKAFPLDMSQYERLFGVSRIPKIDKDELVQCTDARHILILRRGYMYAVDVLDANGNIEAPNVILARLKAVLNLNLQEVTENIAPLGVLTTGERNTWARTREHLVKNISALNKHLLQHEVDAALFCVCLDDKSAPVFGEHYGMFLPLLKHLLCGVGTNRWFDKSISLLLSADGTAAVNFEHSWGDGVAVLRYFNDIYKETIENPFVNVNTVAATNISGEGKVRQITFEIDKKLHADINQAIASNAKRINKLNIHMLQYPHLNKVTCKRHQISPDSFMQLSFQLAYRQSFKRYVGTYESCSTAAFRHGRTETIRPCTMATKQFCEALLASSKRRKSSNELRALIDHCSTVHGRLTKEAAMGQGFDRHLFALKNISNKHNLPLPELYKTEAFNKINHNIISTSTLSSNALLAGSFGPVVLNGLGIGYSIQNEECGAIVTSYENQCNGKLFIESLEDAFRNIKSVIDESKK